MIREARGSFSMSKSLNVVAQTDHMTVIDGLLSSDQRDRLWNYFQLQPFQRVETLEGRGHSPVEDGGVLRGPTVGWGHSWDAQYPTETVVDEVMKAVATLPTFLRQAQAKKVSTGRSSARRR